MFQIIVMNKKISKRVLIPKFWSPFGKVPF